MLKVNFYENVEDSLLKYAVIIAKAEDRFVYCRHKDRDTYEIPGGHREPGEDIGDTAKRELYEETGAIKFDLFPVSVYCVNTVTGADNIKEETYGMLYYAVIKEFGPLPNYEIEEIVFLDKFPEKWTYPLIQPKLIEKAGQIIGSII